METWKEITYTSVLQLHLLIGADYNHRLLITGGDLPEKNLSNKKKKNLISFSNTKIPILRVGRTRPDRVDNGSFSLTSCPSSAYQDMNQNKKN